MMSLIDMETHYQSAQAKSDTQHIKMQREEKKRKQDIKLKLVKYKATKNHIGAVLLYEQFKLNACRKNHQEMEE